MERFKGQREKEAFIQRLLLSFKKEMEGVQPPFSDFVRECELRITQKKKAREQAVKRWRYTLRWGAGLAAVLLFGFLIIRQIIVQTANQDFVTKQMGLVQTSEGAHLRVSRYDQNNLKVIHFVLSSGEATFRPEKLPPEIRYIVETPHLYLRVVGTIFHLRVLSNETLVNVEEGKVWCYPKAEKNTLNQILQETTNTSMIVLEKGSQYQEKITSSSSSPSFQKPRKETSSSISLPSTSDHSLALPLAKKASSLLFYQEHGNYAVSFLASNILEISLLNGKEKRRISLSSWASKWYTPVLLSDSVVIVSQNGIVLRFAYNGKLLFKMRPVEGKVTTKPLITSQGVILPQPTGLTISLWEGKIWNLPAEKNFLMKSLPYYDETRDILVYANEAGSIAGYSLKKKENLWTHRLVREFVGAPLLGTNGIVYVYGESGKILIAMAISDGHFVWSTILGNPLASISICSDTLLITLKHARTQTIKLFSLKEGDMLTSFTVSGEITSSVTKDKSFSFLTDEGEIYTIFPEEKKLLLIGKDPSLSGLSFLNNKLAGIGPDGITVVEK